jgi:hypothetical protein
MSIIVGLAEAQEVKSTDHNKRWHWIERENCGHDWDKWREEGILERMYDDGLKE